MGSDPTSQTNSLGQGRCEGEWGEAPPAILKKENEKGKEREKEKMEKKEKRNERKRRETKRNQKKERKGLFSLRGAKVMAPNI